MGRVWGLAAGSVQGRGSSAGQLAGGGAFRWRSGCPLGSGGSRSSTLACSVWTTTGAIGSCRHSSARSSMEQGEVSPLNHRAAAAGQIPQPASGGRCFPERDRGPGTPRPASCWAAAAACSRGRHGAPRPPRRAVRARERNNDGARCLVTRSGRRNRMAPCALSWCDVGVEVRGFEPLASSVRASWGRAPCQPASSQLTRHRQGRS
jgi:hypothetical protein